jgi:hypothetical protein
MQDDANALMQLGEDEEEDSQKKPSRLLPGGGEGDEPDARLRKLNMSKGADRSAKGSRRGKAKKGLGEDNVATEMQMSNLSINGRLQEVDMMSIEPGQRQRFKSNQNRGQKNYYQKDVEFEQTQLHYGGG